MIIIRNIHFSNLESWNLVYGVMTALVDLATLGGVPTSMLETTVVYT